MPTFKFPPPEYVETVLAKPAFQQSTNRCRGRSNDRRGAAPWRSLPLLLLAIWGLAWQTPVAGQTWNSAGGGTWNAGGNWTPAVVPYGPGTDAVFGPTLPSVASSTITVSPTIAVGTIRMDSPRTIEITGSQVQFNGWGVIQSAGNLTISSPIGMHGTGYFDVSAGNLYLNSQITEFGPYGLNINSLGGTGSVYLQGSAANTFSNTSMVNNGTLFLQKSPNVVAVPGNLTVNGGTVRWDSSEQVANNSTVTLNGGTLNFNSQAETIGRLNFYGGSIPYPSYGLGLGLSGAGDALVMRNTGLGIPVALTAGSPSNVVFDAANNGTAYISGALDLGNATRTFNVANGTAAVDMQLSGSITGAGGLTKSGPGTMVLNQSSFQNFYTNPFPPYNLNTNSGGSYATYGGTTTVTDGVLQLDASHSFWTSYLGPPSVSGQQAIPGPLTINGGTVQYLRDNQLGSSLITVAGGTLDVNSHVDGIGPLLLQGGNITGTSAGLLLGTSYELQSGSVSARLGGAANLDKTTAGSVYLGGSSANTYTGTTTVTAGALNLQKSPSVVAIPGNLTVNGGTVHWDSSEQVADGSTVTLNAGTLDFNSQAETIGRLNFYGGSIPNPSFGLGLTMAGAGDALVMRNTTLSIPTALTNPGGSNVVFDATNNGTATISGNLNLGSMPRTFQVADGSAAVDMEVSGALSGSNSIQKTGAGTLRISGAAGNTHAGINVQNGALELAKAPGVGVVAASGSVGVYGPGSSALWLAVNQLAGAGLYLTGNVDLNGYSDSAADVHVYSGGHLQIPAGSQLTASAQALVQGDVNLNGVFIAPSFDLSVAGVLHGSGTLQGDLIASAGGTLSPGNSPGTMTVIGNATWAGGANYLFEINDAMGASGSDPGWDLLDITGSLAITASAGNEFTLDVDSLTIVNTPGAAANFNPANSYSWTFASAGGGIVGFDPLAFLLDLSGFSNPFSGTFSIAQLGNNLNLLYTPPSAAVPEPGTLAIWSLLGGLVGASAWRRKRRSLTAVQ